jgi:hypothetical protein
LTLAFDWTWLLLERAAAAHAQGDDGLALETCRRLKAIEKLVEDAAREREHRYPQVEDNRLTVPIGFLRPLSSLLADQERRAKQRAAPELDQRLPNNQAERIDDIIRRLEEVGRLSGPFNHYSGLEHGGPVKSLAAEGDAAVPALLDCLEFDDRLTRVVVHDSRHGSRYLQIQGVSQVAFETLTEILGTREFGRNASQVGPDGANRDARHAMAAAIRAYWEKNRGRNPQEKLLDTLANDQATPEQWLDASIRLTRPADVSGTRYSYATPSRPGGHAPPPFGEPLRGKTSPTLSELLAKRVKWLDSGAPIPMPGSGGIEVYEVFKANDLALDLARWDIEAAIPILRERVSRCAAIVVAEQGQSSSRYERLETDIAAFTLLRDQGGDPAALDDYANWIITLSPEGWSFLPISLFEPLWRFSEFPAMAKAAEALFQNDRSPWVPLFEPHQRGWSELGQRDDVICSPLLGVASFRALVRQGLADARVTSTVSADAQGGIEIQVDPGWMTRPMPFPDDPRIAQDSTGTLRLQDLYAWKLSRVAGFPRYEMYWPQAERDATIARCVELLDRYGEALTAGARRWQSQDLPTWHRHDRAEFAFEPIERPATESDVQQGRAIFSLQAVEQDSVRTASLPNVPLVAEWRKSTATPRWNNQVDASGKALTLIDYDRTGKVWEAEERKTDSGWRRTYGFVGGNTFQGVPAEDVKFPAEWQGGWTEISDTLDARLTLPGTLPAGLPSARVGEPLPLTLAFRNHTGVDANAPADLGRGPGHPELREGLTVQLFRSVDSAGGGPSEREVDPRPSGRYRSDASRNVPPAEFVVAMELDLLDLFAIDQPGFYHLVVRFEGFPADSGLPANCILEARFTID